MTFVLFTASSHAQDGEGLFKAKCNACHMLGKDGTGPNLKGMKQKWEDAGEGELIYEWIKGSATLIASGKSDLAIKAKEYSPTEMPAQDVSNEEIDAILSFVENYEPPVETADVATASGSEPSVKIVPNYKKNLTLFYFLIFALIVQVIAILGLSGSIKTFVKMESYKAIKKNSTLKSLLIATGVFGLISMGNQSFALSFTKPGGAEENLPWLLVEDADIYVLVVVNIAMLFLLFHFRKLFMDISEMVRPRLPKKISARRQRKMNDVLTAAVPIEEEHSILLHHEYDGIKELDNNLPPWWVWMFYGTIIFAVIYIFNYHILGTGDLQEVEYNKSIEQADKEVAAYLDKMAMNVDETNATLMTEESDLSTGKTLFEANCVLCHNPNGEGNIGPNLTDNAWIFGYDVKEVFATIKNGTPNGMPEHASKLNPIQLQQVSSYVLSMPEAEGKGPEGEIIEK